MHPDRHEGGGRRPGNCLKGSTKLGGAMIVRRHRPLRALGMAAWLALLGAWAPAGFAAPHQAAPLRLTHGIASGDVTASEAVIWARANRPAQMVVEYTPMPAEDGPPLRQVGPHVAAEDDFTGKVVLQGLNPDTPYRYWVRFRAADGEEVVSEAGRFRTAPAADGLRPLTLVWWGDLGGQHYCRDPEVGYAIFAAMARLAPDVALANGDAIYADGTCPPTTTLPDHPRNALSPDPTTAAFQLVSAADPRLKTEGDVLAAYRAKWKYNLEDEAYRRFRAQTPHIYQWDDHEVINDWYPGDERLGALRGTADERPLAALIEPGRRSFFEYTPIRPQAEGRLYRSFRFGKLAEVFVLDGRSYRDDNILPDGAGTVLEVRLRNGERRRLAGKPKSLLGSAQRHWLLQGLRAAQARGTLWKIIASDVPLSHVTGSYQLYAAEGPMLPRYQVRDGWAAGMRLNSDTDGNQDNPLGFESELRAILRAIKAEGIGNVVWLATDVHVARLLRYEPGGELAGLVWHEFIAGPASAVAGLLRPLSRTFSPFELFAQGRRPDPARPSFFNFGLLRIAADGELRAEIRDREGQVPHDAQGRQGALTLRPTR
jgi:alkaline phosphatase D